MSRTFSLTGLLRLRRTEEEVAGAELARVHTRLRDTAAMEKRARRVLSRFGDVGTLAGDVPTADLRAIAAARLSSAVLLHELDALGEAERANLAQAQARYTQAKRRTTGLEKLEDKHNRQVARDELAAEQHALDEIASRQDGDDS